jgi:hypothetical protein
MSTRIPMPAALALLAASLGTPAGDAADPPPLFPFVFPWDDGTPSFMSQRRGTDPPAGAAGPITVGPDGHFHAGGRRVRFFGVNVCFAACFPRPAEAEKIAARMAKFGINVVRFHHMDMREFPDGILARGAAHTRDLDPEALERLDSFLDALKRHGIYANLNLLVSRSFKAADGLPAEIESLGWKERHLAGFFHAPMIELQKEYARKLLTHRNPRAGAAYAEDPAVAFVEIHNENGLVQGWLGNELDRMPEVFQADLRRQWNDWLVRKHGSTEKLKTAWGAASKPLGAEMLAGVEWASASPSWTLERHAGAEARAAWGEDPPAALQAGRPGARAVRLDVSRPGGADWHVQFNQGGLKVAPDQSYTLAFWAKADAPCDLAVNIGQAHDPWQMLGFATSVRLGTDWRPFQFVCQPTPGDDNARLNFSGLGRRAGSVWLSGASFRPGGTTGLEEGERIEAGTVPLFARGRFGERTPDGQRDWLRFLLETEDRYWQGMARHLKDDLKVRGLVMGTIVGCSTPNLMARFDAVDTHSYWQHPHFPGRPWDAENWVVRNRSMVNERGGTLPGLSLRRVLGKPHNVTEYNHSAPNTYGSEGYLLLAAYGALQDWDAIYAFSYCHRQDDWDARRIPEFFDIDQHPTKWATIVPAASLFVRGDVKPARQVVAAALNADQESDLLRRGRAWDLVHGGHVGIPREAALIHRVALAIGGRAIPAGALKPGDVKTGGNRIASDTGELAWNLSEKERGVVTVDTPRSKAVIGFGAGRRFDLGGVVVEPGPARQEHLMGSCIINITKASFVQSHRRLALGPVSFRPPGQPTRPRAAPRRPDARQSDGNSSR